MNLPPTEIIIQAHFDMLNTLGNAGMLWWVSSVIFYTTILRMTADYKTNSKQMSISLILFMGSFLISIILFGVFMSNCVVDLKIELQSVIGVLDQKSVQIKMLFQIIEYGYLIGALSFAVLFICWIYMLLWVGDKRSN